MIVAVSRAVELLADADAGVNAQLAEIPATPAREVPPVAVLSVFEHPWLARGLLDLEVLQEVLAGPDGETLVERPILAVSILADGETTVRVPANAKELQEHARVPVLVRYLGRSDATDVLLRDAYLTLRAAARVFSKRAHSPNPAVRNLTRDGCVVGPPAVMAYAPVVQSIRDVLLVSGLIAEFPVSDRWVAGLGAP